ncbi:SIMPL domain-containing protein [Sinomicrobium oceani]|uniref:SIMPL domain-containing protein n=1 Tax=Sinomicrobium oceani TaxID=1150368 RepID=UPI00227A5F93|nr:SIMPL domain-containing protein [Sinomicrobium oceani]
MKKCILTGYILLFAVIGCIHAQNFKDHPYLETSASADTLVIPDRIYLSITLSESDSKGKRSVEETETVMVRKLESLGIDIKTQLTLSDLSSNFRNYLLRKQDVEKSRTYELLVRDIRTAGQVAGTLEEAGISNISLTRTEYSGMEALKLQLRSAAIRRARQQAEAMTAPLGQEPGKAIYLSDTDTRITSALQGRVRGLSLTPHEQQEVAPAVMTFEKIKVQHTVRVWFSLR